MQSQSSQDSSFFGPLSLSLSKFSYATVPEDSNAPIPWIHLSSRGSLFAVFEKCRSWSHQGQLHNQSKFRVANGAEVMEDLNLIALAAEARKATDQNQVSNVFNRPSAVTIIVKKPCVAVRYPAGQGQIRRFQIRFLHDTDFYAAMGRFSEANAPVTEAGTFPTPQPQPRPYSSSSSVLCPSDSASHCNAQPPSTTIAFQSNNTSASTSSMLNGAENFLRAETSVSSSTNSSTRIQRTPQSISSETYDQKEINAFLEDAARANPIRPHSGPTTSQYWTGGHLPMRTSNQPSDVGHLASHRLTSSTVWTMPVTNSSHPPINLYKPRPSTAPVIESQGLSRMLPPKRDLPFTKPLSKSSSKASKTTTGMAEAPSPALPPKEDHGFRPSPSMPSHSHELETQSAPPKAKPKRAPAKNAPARVTKKPAVPRSRKKAVSIRAASPVPGVEDLLRRSQEPAKDVTSISKTIDTQALLAHVEERQAIATNQGLAEKSSLAPSFAQAATVTERQDLRILPLEVPSRMGQASDSSLLKEPDSKAENVLSATEVLNSHLVSNRQVQMVPNLTQGTPSGSPTAPSDPNAVRRVLSELPQNTTPTLCKPSVQPLANPLPSPLASLLQDADFAGSPNLAQWAKGPEEERRASLETFICRSLQDENFFQLCKDLDGTWQRVFLGKVV